MQLLISRAAVLESKLTFPARKANFAHTKIHVICNYENPLRHTTLYYFSIGGAMLFLGRSEITAVDFFCQQIFHSSESPALVAPLSHRRS